MTSRVALCSVLVWTAGCGARSELDVGGAPPAEEQPSGQFCVEQEYRGSWRDLSIYLLLDRSGSMLDDHKWDEASAALASFVEHPQVAGMGMALQYYPRSPDSCDPSSYAVPAVSFARLPENGEAIKSSLAAQQPEGDTPMRPALRSAIEYSRALTLGDPTQGVAVALTTDGAPNSCESTGDSVAAVAAEGIAADPQVLTFVIGLDTGYIQPLERIAQAGGTGAPVIIGGEDSAQQLVDALLAVRDDLLRCRYAVPPVPGFEVAPRDVSVRYRLAPGDAEHPLDRVAGAGACGGDAFFLDEQAAEVELCPSLCAELRDRPSARVIVRAGCGEGDEPVDGGAPSDDCDAVVPFYCLPRCGSQETQLPECVGGAWTCPPGTVTTQSCQECAVVPHGCCRSDGTQAVASCIDGNWVCPPGSVIFGSAGCLPPEVCAATLPCPLGSYCKLEDASCGGRDLLGRCEPLPSSCSGGGPPVCACNGQTYPTSCHAALATQDLSAVHGCAAPAGTFACGAYFCNIAAELCLEIETPSELVKRRHQCVPRTGACQSGCTGCKPCPACPPGKVCPEDPLCSTRGSALTVTCLQL